MIGHWLHNESGRPVTPKRIKEILPKLSLDSRTVFGVVGGGAIGSAIAEYLSSCDYDVIIYDEDNNVFNNNIHLRNCCRVNSIAKVIVGSNIIFGCTGRDISKKFNFLELIKAKTTLISTSSQDIEFRELLKARKIYFKKPEDGVLSSLSFPSASEAEITVLESGFPVNFDRTSASDPIEDMELTRGLLLGAFIQAVTTAQKPIGGGTILNTDSHLMLDPYVQQFVARRWLKRQQNYSHSAEKAGLFEEIESIIKNSGGEYEENRLLSKAFLTEDVNDNAPRYSPSLK